MQSHYMPKVVWNELAPRVMVKTHFSAAFQKDPRLAKFLVR